MPRPIKKEERYKYIFPKDYLHQILKFFRGILLFFGAVLVSTTSYEVYSFRWRRRKSYSSLHELIISFSLINNTRKILSTKQNNSLGLECVNGIKALAMIFIIAGHACLFIGSGPVMDAEAWDRVSYIFWSYCYSDVDLWHHHRVFWKSFFHKSWVNRGIPVPDLTLVPSLYSYFQGKF